MIKTVNNITPSQHAQAMGLDPDFLPPFALRENEQVIPVIVERENHKLTSRYEAEFLVSVGVISEDVDIKLLEIINKFIVINVRQLLSVATLDGIEIKREQVMSSIKKLLKYRFIQAVRFENGVNTKSKSGYVIALECNGSLLLKARHRDDSV